MKGTTIISIILGVCLLATAGWGVFNYISLGQTIGQHEDEISSLQDEILSLEEDLANETKRANELQYQYSYLQSQYSDL